METERGQIPNRTECIVISSVMQCQVLNAVMTAVIPTPAMTVAERDLSNVKTRWSTVATATSMERSSPEDLLALSCVFQSDDWL